jgi:hypothetical protein
MVLVNTAAAKTVIVCFTVTPKIGGKKSDKRILAEACHTSKKSKIIGHNRRITRIGLDAEAC